MCEGNKRSDHSCRDLPCSYMEKGPRGGSVRATTVAPVLDSCFAVSEKGRYCWGEFEELKNSKSNAPEIMCRRFTVFIYFFFYCVIKLLRQTED